MADVRNFDMLKAFHKRYHEAELKGKSNVLDEFCQLTQYHRKYAITLLNRPLEPPEGSKRKRGVTYSKTAIDVLAQIWKAARYPWSVRLKAILPLWLPWAQRHIPELTPEIERQLLTISPRQIDRRLRAKKNKIKRRIYGATKPGSLLRHQIPVKTEHWNVQEPGYLQIDLVSHSGDCASGEFIYSLDVTDIFTGWTETMAVMGKGETGVVHALDTLRNAFPFPVKAIHSDNGSEFINAHLKRYCDASTIEFTRSRPYRKNDNAHIEQKNWTHVRKLLGWERHDTYDELNALNNLYRNDLRLLMNLYHPSVKLVEKKRIGSRTKRIYDSPKPPLDRLVDAYSDRPVSKAACLLIEQRRLIDPFELEKSIEVQLNHLEQLRRLKYQSRHPSSQRPTHSSQYEITPSKTAKEKQGKFHARF